MALALRCGICMENMEVSPTPDSVGERMSSTNCGHLYHRQCISQWIETRRENNAIAIVTCPTCRRQLTHVFELFPEMRERDEDDTHDAMDMQRQIDVLQEKVSEVQGENRQLREQNGKLQDENRVLLQEKSRIVETYQNTNETKERYLRQMGFLQQKVCDLQAEKRNVEDTKRHLEDEKMTLLQDTEEKSKVIETYRNIIISKEETLYIKQEENKQLQEVMKDILVADFPPNSSHDYGNAGQLQQPRAQFGVPYSCKCLKSFCRSGLCGCKQRNIPCNAKCHCSKANHACYNVPNASGRGCHH